MGGSGPYSVTCDKLDDTHHSGAKWFFSRKEIEENSPSRRDGIDLKKETSLRKSYCTFLQDLGMRLKVPQVTIATAIVFCHRFFLRQSHARNDSRTIATACMFLAGKVEETPHPLKDVIIISYEIIHKKDPSIMQKIKQKEVYEQQKEIVLLGERVVLATLAFDLTVHHPYKPLVEALKKLKVAQNTLAQVAWNFVNDGLRTSLCLQHKPNHIAAGAISLAGKFLNVKLPSNGKKVWWEEFDVTSRQLEDVSNQMMELYNQKRSATSSRPNEVKGSTVPGSNRSMAMASTICENPISASGSDAIGTIAVKKGSQVTPADHRVGEGKDCLFNELMPFPITCSGRPMGDEVRDEKGEITEARGDQKSSHDQRDLIEKINTVRVKTTMQKRRKSQDGAALRTESKEDDLIERELETDFELAREDEKKEQKNQPFPTEQAAISNERSFSLGTAIFTPKD